MFSEFKTMYQNPQLSMERVKGLMIILMKERDRAKKRVDDLNLELKITTEKLMTVGKVC